MATTSFYKNFEREPRRMLTEEAYGSGISYTNAPLEDAYAKLLVNYDIKDDGMMLKPRGGYQAINTLWGRNVYGTDLKFIPLDAQPCTVHIKKPNVGAVTDFTTDMCLVAQRPDRIAHASLALGRTVNIYKVADSTMFVNMPRIPNVLTEGYKSVIWAQTLPSEYNIEPAKADLLKRIAPGNVTRSNGTSAYDTELSQVPGLSGATWFRHPITITDLYVPRADKTYTLEFTATLSNRNFSTFEIVINGTRITNTSHPNNVKITTTTVTVTYEYTGNPDAAHISEIYATFPNVTNGHCEYKSLTLHEHGQTKPVPPKVKPLEDISQIHIVTETYNQPPVIHGLTLQEDSAQRPITFQLNSTLYILCASRDALPPKEGEENEPIEYGEWQLFWGELRIEYDNEVMLPSTLTLFARIKKPEAMSTTVKEVLTSGYNMLSDTPYQFANRASTTWNIDGILPYDKPATATERQILLSANTGQMIYFDLIYQYVSASNTTIRTRWEWSEAGSGTWNYIQTEKDNDTANPGIPVSPNVTMGDRISLAFQPSVDQFQLRVSMYTRNASGTLSTAPVQVTVLPIYRLAGDTGSSTRNLSPINYNLATATGAISWKQRAFVWGVSGAEQMLFASDINNALYFPYPNNIALFDEHVIYVTQYLDVLLVFTSTKVYSLTLTDDGMGFITTLIQSRLNFTQADKHVIQVVKNMVFFKSDNYYYMIVPKATSLRGELIIAPVSNPVVNLLDDVRPVINQIITEFCDVGVVGRPLNVPHTYSLEQYYNFVDNTTVRVVLGVRRAKYTTETGVVFPELWFNFMLNYDTATRAWTTYIFSGNGRLIPVKQTITDNTLLLSVFTEPGLIIGPTAEGQEITPTEAQDYYFMAQLIKMNENNPADTFTIGYTGAERVRNYQLLDTGYRKHGDQHKKRYRELQFNINNTSEKKLSFYTEFFIDEDKRNAFYEYVTQWETDPQSPNYGTIYITRQLTVPKTVYGNTILNGINNEHKLLRWELDGSKFPVPATTKVRFVVSGKGYRPRLRLISYNELEYELLNTNWVFRTLYAR